MNTTFGMRLSELLEDNNIDALTLSKMIGVSDTIVSRWKRDKASIILKHFIRTADIFDCSLDYLAGRSDYDTEYTKKPCPPFSRQLRTFLAAEKKTVYQITKETKLSRSRFSDWYKGCQPKLNSLVTLSDYLCCSLDDLVGRR